MAYTRTNWEDSPSTNTPINATNLNNMEQGIYDAHKSIEKHPSVYVGTASWNSDKIDVDIADLDIGSVLTGDIFILNFQTYAVLKRYSSSGANSTIICISINNGDIASFIYNVTEDIIVIKGDYIILEYVKRNDGVCVFIIQYISNNRFPVQLNDMSDGLSNLNDDVNKLSDSIKILNADVTELQVDNRAIYGKLEYSSDSGILNLITNYKGNYGAPYKCYGYTDKIIDIKSNATFYINGSPVSYGGTIEPCTINADCTAEIAVKPIQGVPNAIITNASITNKWGASIDYEVTQLKSEIDNISTLLDVINGEVI